MEESKQGHKARCQDEPIYNQLSDKLANSTRATQLLPEFRLSVIAARSPASSGYYSIVVLLKIIVLQPIVYTRLCQRVL